VRANHVKKEDIPFELEKVRDEDLYLIPDQDWALKPLSLRDLIRLLQMIDSLLKDTDNLWDAIQGVTEDILVEFLSLLVRRPVEFIRANWEFGTVLEIVGAFWHSPERRYLAAREKGKPEVERSTEPIPWITNIVERLSSNRGWTVSYILDLPFLAVLKLLSALDERGWDEQVEMVQNVERGVARAVAAALGKADALPELPRYRETRRKMREAEAIKEKGRRFFDAALR
jgi:hypothetical protein